MCWTDEIWCGRQTRFGVVDRRGVGMTDRRDAVGVNKQDVDVVEKQFILL